MGLALPFIAAFYLLNDVSPIVIPILNIELGNEIAMTLKILKVTFHYVIFLLFFIFSGGLSRLTLDSKLHLVYPVVTLLSAIIAFLTHDKVPSFSLLFGILSLLYLLFVKFEDGNLSLLIVGITGAFLALLSFVVGILWFENHFLFQPAISSLFGFATLNNESLKTGSIMFITIGYVIFYAVFQTGEFWSDSRHKINK